MQLWCEYKKARKKEQTNEEWEEASYQSFRMSGIVTELIYLNIN